MWRSKGEAGEEGVITREMPVFTAVTCRSPIMGLRQGSYFNYGYCPY
jgi:hypothetical protein